MSSIDPTSKFLAQITEQVSGIARQVSRETTTNRTQEKSKPQKSEDSRNTQRDLQAIIARRIQAINPDDPHRQRRAFRLFLEAVLVNELGEHLVNDAGFHELVENVQKTMEQDKSVASAIDKAGTYLLDLAKRVGKN